MAYQWCLTMMICFWLDVLNCQLSKILCVRLLGMMRLQELFQCIPSTGMFQHPVHHRASVFVKEKESGPSIWIPIKWLKMFLVNALILHNLAPTKKPLANSAWHRVISPWLLVVQSTNTNVHWKLCVRHCYKHIAHTHYQKVLCHKIKIKWKTWYYI